MAALALVAVVFSSGCGHYSHHGYGRHTSSGHHEAVALGVGIIAGAAIVAASERRREPVIVYERVYVTPGPAPAPLPASPRDQVLVEEGPPPFDPAAARAQLSATDVTSCRPRDGSLVSPAYGHATVTFNPDGIISKVAIDEPGGLPPATVQCIGDRLGAASVRPFRGSLVTVGTVFRM